MSRLFAGQNKDQLSPYPDERTKTYLSLAKATLSLSSSQPFEDAETGLYGLTCTTGRSKNLSIREEDEDEKLTITRCFILHGSSTITEKSASNYLTSLWARAMVFWILEMDIEPI